jgi:hypothetical protein
MALEHDAPPVDLPLEWSRCNWWTHPLFRSLTERPVVCDVKLAIRNAIDHDERMWAVRAALFSINTPGMRGMLLECFEDGIMPEAPMALWPHGNLRARFIRDELAHMQAWQPGGASHANWIRALACCWPWLWKEEAQQQGMGEAHPIVRFLKSGYGQALPVLFALLPPQSWLDWQSSGSEKMVAYLVRKASLAEFADIVSYDPRLLAWSHKKDGRSLLHEACMKLRPDLVAWLISKGARSQAQDRLGQLPAHVALYATIEDMSHRHVSRQKLEHGSERLREVLCLLGRSGGLANVSGTLLNHLRPDRLDRLRMAVEDAVLRAAAPMEPDASKAPHRL